MTKGMLPTAPSSRISAAHAVILALSLVMTVGAYQFSKDQIKSRTENRFKTSVSNALGLIEGRMKNYEDALWAGVAAVNSHGGDMTLEEWRHFSGTLEIEQRYPGINGIGVIHYVTREALPRYLSEHRRETPGFKIHPPHEQDFFLPITYIEPVDINRAAVGLDVAHETNRRTAALASRDSGEAQITGPIILVQDAGHTPGFLFYTPFYRDARPSTLAERRESFVGAVYAPFVVKKLMEGLLAKELRDIRFSISDGGQVIYDEHSAMDPLNDPDPMFTDRVSLDLYGRTWVMDLRSNLDFRSDNAYAQPTIILFGGVVIELLIVAMLLHMANANRHTLAYADRVTADLRAERQELKKTNDELEQFAFVASHDLKTPIRGIAGLTAMVKEDLEQYFAEENANPDVSRNLDRIQERVGRMERLIQGVMEFSRVGRSEEPNEKLRISDEIEAIRSDLGLEHEELQLNGSVEWIDVDTFNFRRVLENLIGNSKKYHNGMSPLRIVVSVHPVETWLSVTVEDNGPGIDPRFHTKIFGVFQTLRRGDMPDSTGIGLAIVKKSVERHGGKVTVSSDPGAGAKFSFDWPSSANMTFSPHIRKAA